MIFQSFICAGYGRGTLASPVPAPYFRKTFQINKKVRSAGLGICGLGFYRLFFNGKEITKGYLAPYCSNSDDLVYYDRYEVQTRTGENVIGVILGNGFQNALGGSTWDFDKAAFQSEPKLSLWLELQYEDGTTAAVISDESFLTHPAPILFNDLWCGESYDANLEIPGWNLPGFPAGGWQKAKSCEMPKGEQRLRTSLPVVCERTISPVDIQKVGEDYLYDFGENNAGLCQLMICGERGQTIVLKHGEYFSDGVLNQKGFLFLPEELGQVDRYTLKGDTKECYVPSFTYHGFRYVQVTGITKEQATKELLTYLVIHADLKTCGGFSCSDRTANLLQEMTRRSTLANFYHYPTDCPHREKNGWTGDAALSAEQTVINFWPEQSYREWLYNITKAQEAIGCLPGIVPTGGWGMGIGGPAWDAALIVIPYYIYIYRGDKELIRISEKAILRYLRYLAEHKNTRGCIEIGLGDWCPAGKENPRDFKAPVEVTDTFTVIELCRMSEVMLSATDHPDARRLASRLKKEFILAARTNLIDQDTLTALGSCQTSQALLICSGILTGEEEERAYQVLLEFIQEAGDHLDVGIIGGRVLFHALSRHGGSELAFDMITRRDYPSYGNLIERGYTTLCESFQPVGGKIESMNHHMWGDISAWFIKILAGIRINPSMHDSSEIRIEPHFIRQLSSVSAWHQSPLGRVEVMWKRYREEDEGIELTVELPQGVHGKAVLGEEAVELRHGKNRFVLKNTIVQP